MHRALVETERVGDFHQAALAFLAAKFVQNSERAVEHLHAIRRYWRLTMWHGRPLYETSTACQGLSNRRNLFFRWGQSGCSLGRPVKNSLGGEKKAALQGVTSASRRKAKPLSRLTSPV